MEFIEITSQEPEVKQERDTAENEASVMIHHQNKASSDVEGNILKEETKCELTSNDDNDNTQMSGNIESHNKQLVTKSGCINVYDDMIDIVKCDISERLDNVGDVPAPGASNVARSQASSKEDIPLKRLRRSKSVKLSEDMESGPALKKRSPITSEHRRGNTDPAAALHNEGDTFSCRQCNYNTTNKYSFKTHLTTHTVAVCDKTMPGMSTWRLLDNEEQPPQDFLDLLYDEEGGSGNEEVDDEDLDEGSDDENEPRDGESHSPRSMHRGSPQVGEAEDDVSLEAPSYSPLSSPERRRRSSSIDEIASPPRMASSYDRPRSPLGPISSESSGVVLRIFDEYGVPLDAVEEFVTPDTHALFLPPEEHDRDERDEMSVSGRRGERSRGRRGERGSGRRGVRRGVRGQSGYTNQGRRGRNSWVVGQPLNEIWLTDEDVPPELVSLATDVFRRRQMSMQDSARAERNAEREDDSESEDDEYFDATNEADDLPRLEGQNLHFEWSPMDSFQGKEEHFRPERTGSVHVVNSAYDAFRLYWDDDILAHIVTETNLHATKIVSAGFQSEWFPTNLDEILCLFSFWMMLGIVRMPTVTSCFSVDPLLRTEVFRRIFTRRRYEMLNRALNFVDSDPAMNNSNPFDSSARSLDRLHRLRPILTHLNSRFQSNYILNKDICIDESLTLWKGRLNFKQYIQNKASKFGIKTFELCESTTGYLWSFIVYSGKQSADLEQSPGVLKSTAVVKKLIGPLLNKGYRLFMDNWYNSPLLARFLKINGTDCVGTLRSSRRDVPLVVNKAPLKRGELIARHSGDVTVLSWQDKKRVTMISTCHGSSTALPTVSSRPRSKPVPFKPQMVLDYNKFMGGIDLKDQMLEPYLLERKRCAKWYMKLFKRLLNVSILNSRTLLQSSKQKHQDHLAFRLQLVDSILTNHLSHCPRSRRLTALINRSTRQQPDRITISTHWPVLLEPTASSSARNRNFAKRCVVCLREGRKSQKSTYCCESCRVPLCINNCFKSYHTSPS